MNSRHTLAGSINDLHETHAVIHYKLFAVGIFYRWIVSLREARSAADIAMMTDGTTIPLRRADGSARSQSGWQLDENSPTKQLSVN